MPHFPDCKVGHANRGLAREASKRIVDNILLTAGEDLEDPSEYSPTVVKMNQDILDDTF